MIKTLAKSIREYKFHTIITPIFVALESAIEVFIPFLMAQIVDRGINESNVEFILKCGGVLLAAALASLLFGILAGRTSAVASSGFAKNLRNDLFERIQGFSFANIDRISPSGLITRLTTDVTYTQMAYMMLIRMFIRSPLLLVFSLIMAFSINTTLALIFLALIPVLGILIFIVVKIAYPIYTRAFDKYDKLNNIMQENLHGIRVVKSYVREEHEKEKFNKVSQDIYKDFTAAEKLMQLSTPFMQFSIYTVKLLIAWIGAHLIVQNFLTQGELMSMITYAIQMLMSLMMFSMVIVMLTISRASVKRISEIINEETTIKNPENALTVIKNGDIAFENASFSYYENAEKFSLSDVNLTIKSGETIGIIGGTGSSKTTLVQLVPRLYDATKGSVLVGGEDVRSYDVKALRDSVAMVLQKNILFSGTIKENLRWGSKDATDEELEDACKLAQAHPFIMSFTDGYDHYVEQGGANLSGGQRQRLCIARAILKKPAILILDDSTSAVDMRTDASIRKSLKESIPGTTKIIIARRAASVMDADKIVVMDDGCVADSGTHTELLKRCNIYKEVYESQIKGGGDFDAEN